jgi:Putative Actinobacterial Holin-X, holin superfamily III
MAERLGNSDLIQSLGDLLGDLSDLVQKEIWLAKAEVTERLTSKLQAGGWLGVAALFGLLTAVLIVEASVFAIASYGIPLHWACLLVAVVLGAAGLALFYHGRSLAEQELTPKRALRQVAQDIKTAKEQLT